MSTYAVGSAVSERVTAHARALRPAAPRVRLTRRGRLLVTLILTLVVVAALGTLRSSVMASGADDGPVASYVTVQPGQTLWQIAGAVAPRADRRDTVSRILAMNNQSGADLAVGQRLAVPARR